MTGSEIASIITALGLLVTALTSAAAVIIGLKNKKGIDNVISATDGMKDELVKVTGKAAFAEGTAAGLVQGRSEAQAIEPVKVEIVNIPPTLKT